MNELQKAAVITALIENMGRSGSWCGETHIQKAIYFLQELCGVDLEFPYRLYKHGPFSFELRDEIADMRAVGLLNLVPQPYPYGPSFSDTDSASILRDRLERTVTDNHRAVDFIAKKLGSRGVTDLEQISTALLVIRGFSDAEADGHSDDELADVLIDLKPHVSKSDALAAINNVQSMMQEWLSSQ